MRFFKRIWIIAAAGLCFVFHGGIAAPESVDVPPIKTSIYVGSVTLTTTTFTRDGQSYTATYEARVFPWAFWNEHGNIIIRAPQETMTRFEQGETVELAGEATNHRGRPREVTLRATPEGADAGRVKVQIKADGVELIFNGPYAASAGAGG